MSDSQIVIEGEAVLPVSRELAWEYLNDPQILKQCIKGCDDVNKDEDGNFHAVFVFRMRPFHKVIDAVLTVNQIDPPACYSLSSSVSTKAMGNASGTAMVRLAEKEGATFLQYRANIGVTGWFARMGGKMVEDAAGRYMATFFDRFVNVIAH